MSGVAPMNLDPMTVARAFKESGMFPDLRSEAQAVVKIVAGQEVGFGPMASMQAVQMIQGKPTFSANALAALVKRHPTYNYRATEHTETVCRLQFYEDGEPSGVSEFSIEDAQRAGIAGGQSWRKYPKAMLFARALSQGVRWYAPDVTAGAAAYVPEELEETSAVPAGSHSLPDTAAEAGQVAEGSVGLPAAEGDGPGSPSLSDAEVTELAKLYAASGYTFERLSTAIGSVGGDAPKINRKDSIRKAVASLSREQADKLGNILDAAAAGAASDD